MEALILLILLGIPLGYVAFQCRVLRSWQGAFHSAAALPLLGWLIWGVIFVIAIARDPTSHNLFPFEILIGAIVASAYLGVLATLKRLLGA